MLEYTRAGDGARLMMLVHHDDAAARVRLRTDSRRSARSQATLMTEAKKKGWIVISMKNDWKHIFAFEDK